MMAYRKRTGPSRRDRWRTELAKASPVPAACRLFFLTHVVQHMSADGYVSIPRSKLAARAGVSERRVTQWFSQAKEHGYITVIEAGYRTHTAVYQATFPTRNSGNDSCTQSEPESGKESGKDAGPLLHDQIVPPFPLEKGERIVPSSLTYVRDPFASVSNDAFSLNEVHNVCMDEMDLVPQSWRSAPRTEKLVDQLESEQLHRANRHLSAVPA